MMTNLMLKANAWKNYYYVHPDTDVSNNALTGLGDIFTVSAAYKDSFHTFRLNKDMFLLGVKPNGHELQVFHQGYIIGDSYLNLDKIYVTLMGHGSMVHVIEL
jgi:hypothetical protein